MLTIGTNEQRVEEDQVVAGRAQVASLKSVVLKWLRWRVIDWLWECGMCQALRSTLPFFLSQEAKTVPLAGLGSAEGSTDAQ